MYLSCFDSFWHAALSNAMQRFVRKVCYAWTTPTSGHKQPFRKSPRHGRVEGKAPMYIGKFYGNVPLNDVQVSPLKGKFQRVHCQLHCPCPPLFGQALVGALTLMWRGEP